MTDSQIKLTGKENHGENKFLKKRSPVTRKDKSDLKKNHEVEDINFVDTDTVGGSGLKMFCSGSRC